MEVLKVITDMEFDTLDGDARTKDAVFSKFGEVQASNTPVIFNTPSDPTVLMGEHAYPVLNTSIDNGVRM